MRGVTIVVAMCAGCDWVLGLAPANNCLDGACLTVLAPDEAGASEIVADAEGLFWALGGANGAIRGCAIEGCQPRSLTSVESSPHSLLLGGSEIMWASGRDLRAVDRTATAAVVTAFYEEVTDPVVDFVRIASRGRIYYSTRGGMKRCTYRQDPISRCSGGSTISALVLMTGVIATDRSDRIWAGGDARLYVDNNMDEVDRYFEVPGGARAIAVGEQLAFAIPTTGAELLAWSIDAPAMTSPTRIDVGGTPRALALDSLHVYIADASGRVLRVATVPELGEVEVVAASLPPISDLAVGDDAVYLVADDRIAALPKPPPN
jgi:hypothetical protein